MLLLFLFLLVFFMLLFFYNISKNKNDYFFYFIIVGLIVLESIKYKSGTDYFFYFNDYQNYFDYHNYHSRYEPLYSLISKFAIKLKMPYHFFLFFYYSVYYFLIGFTIKKYSSYPLASLFLFFCISIGLMGSNRQLMATAIIFISTFYFFSNHYSYKHCFLFLLVVSIAINFHYSALLTLPIVFFKNKISNRFWLIGLVIVLFFLFFEINNYIILNANKLFSNVYINLVNKYKSTGNVVTPIDFNLIFGILRRGLLVFMFFKLEDKLKFNSIFYVLYNISWFSLIFYIYFYTMPFIGSRAGNYFLIFESISYILIFKSLHQNIYQNIFLIFILVLGVFLFFKNISLYPELFIPFQTIFGTF